MGRGKVFCGASFPNILYTISDISKEKDSIRMRLRGVRGRREVVESKLSDHYEDTLIPAGYNSIAVLLNKSRIPLLPKSPRSP